MRLSVRTGVSVVLALAALAVLQAFAADSQGGKVVVTRPGVVFHKAGAADVRGRGVERTVDAALEAGYTPCPICFAKEISVARAGSLVRPGGAEVASSSVESIPAPPVSTVTQPFGLRFASTRFLRTPRDGIRNPYDDLVKVVPGRSEQGAFGER